MRQSRFIFIAFLASLLVPNAAFLRLNSFSNQSEIANAATPPAKQPNISLAGKWKSDWGTVEFNSDLSGHWNQGIGIGKITDGTYDPKSRKLIFHYYQSWNQMNGTATLTLSQDGSSLSGTWIQQRGSSPAGSGGSGGWVMIREPQQHWSLKAGVQVSQSIEEHINKIANAYFLATSENLVITDGLRTAGEQAQAILNKLENDGTQAVHNLYKNKSLIDEVIAAFNKNNSSGKASQLQTMTNTIQNQMDKGNFISLHLTGRAFDVRSRDMNNTEKSAFLAAVADAGDTLINETSTGEPHYHVQF